MAGHRIVTYEGYGQPQFEGFGRHHRRRRRHSRRRHSGHCHNGVVKRGRNKGKCKKVGGKRR